MAKYIAWHAHFRFSITPLAIVGVQEGKGDESLEKLLNVHRLFAYTTFYVNYNLKYFERLLHILNETITFERHLQSHFI